MFSLKALTLEMTPPKYAWITFGWFSEGFWNQSSNHCNVTDLVAIVKGMVFVDQYPRFDSTDAANGTIIGDFVSIHYIFFHLDFRGVQCSIVQYI